MNVEEFKAKMEDIIKIIEVAMAEASEIEAKRVALEKSGYVNSDREKKIYVREVTITQKEADIEAQKKHMEEQNKNTQVILNKISLEKEALKGLVEEKREIEKERLELEGVKKVKDTLVADKMRFESEKELFNKEKAAMVAAQKLLAIREANIHAKEERLDKIERMTSV